MGKKSDGPSSQTTPRKTRRKPLEYRPVLHLGVGLPCGRTTFIEKHDEKWYEASEPAPGQPSPSPTKLAAEGLRRYARAKFSVRVWNALATLYQQGIKFSIKEPIDVTCPVCGHTQAMN